jgi:SAM-dependent methyltransferase
MKTRESGMPDESMWAGYFSPEQILARLGLTTTCQDVADFGCGYGTFTIPAARIIRGVVHALDIDSDRIQETRRKAAVAGLANVRAFCRDFVAAGTGLPDASVGYVMLFNILHCEDPMVLLREARRILVSGGILGIMHWNYDPQTPRGPSMAIRPRPDQCRNWAQQAGFTLVSTLPVDLPPYHYGIVLRQ